MEAAAEMAVVVKAAAAAAAKATAATAAAQPVRTTCVWLVGIGVAHACVRARVGGQAARARAQGWWVGGVGARVRALCRPVVELRRR